MSSVPRPPAARPARPKYYDLNLLNLPMPGLVSIFHRITGIALFLFGIPLVLFLLQSTLVSQSKFEFWRNIINLPLVKIVLLAFVWSYMHHFFAGIRYLLLDVHVATAKEPAQLSAKIVLVLGILATILIGARIW